VSCKVVLSVFTRKNDCMSLNFKKWLQLLWATTVLAALTAALIFSGLSS
jgi:hypothetical protein